MSTLILRSYSPWLIKVPVITLISCEFTKYLIFLSCVIIWGFPGKHWMWGLIPESKARPARDKIDGVVGKEAKHIEEIWGKSGIAWSDLTIWSEYSLYSNDNSTNNTLVCLGISTKPWDQFVSTSWGDRLRQGKACRMALNTAKPCNTIKV